MIKDFPTLRTKRNPLGFTLIELMIVVAIVAILATIALPSYLQYVKRSDRAAAKAALLENAQFLERNYIEAGNKYDKDSANADVVLPLTQSPKAGTAKYNLSADPLTTSTYTLKAEPISGGPMDGDECGTFTLNNLGQKQLVGASLTVAECWNR